MAYTFPFLLATPAAYSTPTPSTRAGIYYLAGAAPSFTVSSACAAATPTYTVRNYYGTVVSTGTVSSTTVTPTAPSGGWVCGWYRMTLSGSATDANYVNALGSANFIVIRTDARFPTNPAAGATEQSTNSARFTYPDQISRGVLRLGPQRHQVADAAAPNAPYGGGGGVGDLDTVSFYLSLDATYYTAQAPANRPRPLFLQFPNGAVDYLEPIASMRFYPKTEATDATNTTVTVAAATTTGRKITVANGATSEVYDNQTDYTAAAVAINAASTLVKVFSEFTGALPSVTFATTAISRAMWTGVGLTVRTLYPLGISRYEGPINEPQGRPAIEIAHRMRIFQASVKAGNASALAIGPNPVQIDQARGLWFEQFLAAGGGAYCDEFSFHVYNSIVGDINIGQSSFAVLTAQLAAYGFSGKPLWQTEQGVTVAAFGVLKPRAVRQQALQILLQEQNNIPVERNHMWYDAQHGFWSVPCFWRSGSSLNPQVSLLRTLAEETYDRPFTSALTFGPISSHVFLGNVYTAADGRKTVAILCSSAMPSASVTLNVAGASGNLTVVDAWGNTSTVAATAGLVTVPAAEVPTYLELSAGVTPTVHHVNDWPTNEAAWPSPTSGAVATATNEVQGVYKSLDGTWMSKRDGSLGQLAAATAPCTWTAAWTTAVRLNRLLIWCGAAYVEAQALTDFDVQTSNDGTTWTTQATVTNASATSFANADNMSGCTRESYWDEQWFFDVRFPATVTAKYVRLNVRSASVGDTGDAASGTATNSTYSRLALQEVIPVCDANASPQYVRT